MKQEQIRLDQEKVVLGGLGGSLVAIGGIVGLLGIAGGAALGLGQDARTFWYSYLVAFAFWLSLSLGALVFVAIQHATRASWSVVVRRIAELFANNLLLLAILVLPIVFIGAPYLYEWVGGAAAEAAHHSEFHAHLLQHKSPYLNMPFFIFRIVLYFTVWIILARYFLGRSVRQDATGDPEITRRMWVTGGPAILLYALTSTFAAVDLIMSLSPGWFSTMFGVYFFAGSMLGFMALLGASSLFLQGKGHLRHVITNEHYHDIGKLTFAFVFFWGYIAFSQFMLIWYANLPEETGWFWSRQQGNWLWLEVGLLFGHFFIPFLGLISRWVKRVRPLLAFWCIWVLVWHWLDMVYLIMPGLAPEGLTAPLVLSALLLTIGIGGLYVAFFALSAKDKPILPVRDPRLIESLQFDNIKV